MRSLRRRMSVAGCALKLPSLVTMQANRTTKRAETSRPGPPRAAHILHSGTDGAPLFQLAQRIAGPAVAAVAALLEQLPAALRVHAAVHQEVALPRAAAGRA